MGTRGWIIFSIMVVVLLGALVVFSSREKLDVTGYDSASIIGPNDDNGNIGDHVFGNKDSKVVMVEYGDFQCPACASVAPVLKQVAEHYQGEIAFIFRNFPLSSIHPNARIAAATAEAAGLQGKYWEVHNKLYDEQSTWTPVSPDKRVSVFANYAADFGLDRDKIIEALDSDEIKRKIAFDEAIAGKDQVTGTPSIFINGKRLADDATNSAANGDSADLEAEIRSALEKAGVKLPKALNDKK